MMEIEVEWVWRRTMEKDRVQRYAQSLERTIENNYHYLKETMKDFQGLCLLVTPERNVPLEIIIDIRELYKEIRNRFTEIKAIQQLLQVKYRRYYHRDALRDKEIMEFGFILKNCYSKFEYTLMQKQAQEKRKRIERKEAFRIDQRGVPCQWFRSEENQVNFARNLRILKELDYESPPEHVGEERRETIQNLRSLTLFVFSGDGRLIDDLQSQIRWREHDIVERYGRNELHGVLTHLREVIPLELQKMLQRLMESRGFSKLKCLLLPVHSQKEFEGDIMGLIKKTLQEMKEGEVKTISI
jgi:hypothetical protein